MLTKRKNSPYWYAVISIAKYQQKWFCLKTTKKQEAEYLHSALKEKYFEEKKKAHIESILGVSAKPMIETPKDRAKKVLLTDAIHKANELKTLSKDAAETYNRFLAWLMKTFPKITFINQIDKQAALKYIQEKYGTAAPKSYNTIKSTLSSIWKGLAIYDIENIWTAIPNKSIGNIDGYRNLTTEEVKKILDNSSGFWHDATLISYHTGLRKIDIFELEWKHIKDGAIDVVPNKTEDNKKAVYIPLHQDLISLFKTLPKTSNFIFPEAKQKYTSGTFHKQFAKLLEQLEIKDASFHCLRATFITNAEEQGIDRKVIQGIVGHGSPKMTERYSHDKESSKIIRQMPSIINLK